MNKAKDKREGLLLEIKVGDLVKVTYGIGSSLYRFSKCSRITPSGIICIQENRREVRFNPNGSGRGSGTRHRVRYNSDNFSESDWKAYNRSNNYHLIQVINQLAEDIIETSLIDDSTHLFLKHLKEYKENK